MSLFLPHTIWARVPHDGGPCAVVPAFACAEVLHVILHLARTVAGMPSLGEAAALSLRIILHTGDASELEHDGVCVYAVFFARTDFFSHIFPPRTGVEGAISPRLNLPF